MKNVVKGVITGFLIFFLFLSFYSIFNVGNPRSIFRLLVRDPSYDITLTLIVSGITGALAIILYTLSTKTPITQLLEYNADYIKELKKTGKASRDIAESFLQELEKQRKGGKSRKGIFYFLARKKIEKFISNVE